MVRRRTKLAVILQRVESCGYFSQMVAGNMSSVFCFSGSANIT
jgi:hypothetical protein